MEDLLCNQILKQLMIIFMLLEKFVNLVKGIKILHLEDLLEWIVIINSK